MHHEKTDLKVFVIVIPKEGLVGWGKKLSLSPRVQIQVKVKDQGHHILKCDFLGLFHWTFSAMHPLSKVLGVKVKSRIG